MKPIDLTSDSYAEYNKDSNVTKPKFKVGDLVRIQKYKNIFAKGYMQNWSEEVFVASNIKNTVPWTYLIIDLNGENIVGSFYEKELQKLVKKNSEQKKYLKEKVINCMSNGKDIRPCQYFPKPFRSFGGDINVKIDLSNYTTKTDLNM